MPTKTAIGEPTLEQVFYYAGDYDSAHREADSAIANADTDSDTVEGLLAKARIHFDEYRYADSLAQLRLIDKKLDGAEPRAKARAFGQRAAVYAKVGKNDKALIDYEAARYWAKEAGDELCEACIRNNRARLYSKTQRFEEADDDVEFAIATATRLGQQFWLGRFLDQKAKVLMDGKHYAEAFTVSRNAVELLELHGNERTLAEAKITHGQAWIGVGASGLEPSVSFRTLRETVDELNPTLDKELAQLALDQATGNFTQAANSLGVSHVAMIKAVEKFALSRQPKRRRPKSYSKS